MRNVAASFWRHWTSCCLLYSVFFVTKDPELRIPFNDCFKNPTCLGSHSLWTLYNSFGFCHCFALLRTKIPIIDFQHTIDSHFVASAEHWKLFQKSALCSCYLVSVAVSLRRTHNTAHWGNELANPFFACRGRENTLFPIINCCSGCAFYAITFSFVH